MTVGLALILLLDPLKSSGLQGNFKLTGGRVLWFYGAESEHRHQRKSPKISWANWQSRNLHCKCHHWITRKGDAQWPQWMLWGSLVAVGWFVVSSMLEWHAEWKKNLQDPAESHVSVDMVVGRMFVEWSVLKCAMSHSEVVMYHCIPC